MKKKSGLVLFITTVLLIISSINSPVSYAEETVYSPSEPSPYDTEGYALDELPIYPMSQVTYEFWRTTFSNYVWIAGGRGFKNPHSIGIDSVNKNGITIEAYSANLGTYKGKCVTPKVGGWRICNWGHLPRNTTYKFKLVNTSSGTANITMGNVIYSNSNQ
ncbi:hypothetical protein [Metabacillus niabensis]|uniref:hypothetical protein n=1 Tax=Metabacillus niabensis TaxID=324854 RepID=UPI0039A190F3